MSEDLKDLLELMVITTKFQEVERNICYPDGSKENDVMHTFKMQLIFMATEHLLPVGLDRVEMMKELTVHDIGEIKTGDILHKTDFQSDKEYMSGLSILFNFRPLIFAYRRYHDRESEESKL